MRKRPAMAYMAGVMCYAGGYAAFLIFYWRIVRGETEGGRACYCLGSGSFLAGSVFLVLATIPDSAREDWRMHVACFAGL